MNEIEKIAVIISKVDTITYKKQVEILDMSSNISDLKNRNNLLKIITEDDFNNIQNECDLLDKYLNNLAQVGVGVLTIKSSICPDKLREIDNPPIVLYFKGDISLLDSIHSIAIVGTRRITSYGTKVTEMFSGELSKSGFVIISGLASGVDKVAHTSCLDAGGKTIAVLGSGVNEIYPSENIGLSERIIKNGGLILSEYKPNEKPKAFHFPLRNRIVAGLSDGVLITEATLKSGSMHTKNYALDYGEDLFVVPARITDIYSAGCNEIIKSLQGSVVLSPKDILDYYNISNEQQNKKIIQISINEQIVLDIIGPNDLHYEEILSKSSMQTSELNTLLMQMELKGLIESIGGNFYRANK